MIVGDQDRYNDVYITKVRKMNTYYKIIHLYSTKEIGKYITASESY